MNSNNNNINPKCSNCKCYFTPEIKSSGQPFKTCEKCRTKDKGSRNVNIIKEQHNVKNVVVYHFVYMTNLKHTVKNVVYT